MSFDPFVIPFSIGTLFLLAIVGLRLFRWIKQLSPDERKALKNHVFGKHIFRSLFEIIRESLLHRSIFKTNTLLGFMHASLAFGWFLLIVFGNLESRMHSPTRLNFPYYPIFLKFFVSDQNSIPFHLVFGFLMDALLLIVLSGLLLAIIKRFRSRILGMKSTTRLRPGDRWALAALWMIFPLRLLAESSTAGLVDNGGFLTGTLGHWLAGWMMPETLAHTSYAMWWAYSAALGIFFIALPFSRYMHIPAEVILIVFRNAGIRHNTERFGTLAQIECQACSQCGICIDVCQLQHAGISRVQPSYFLRAVRYDAPNAQQVNDCMLCGRCTSACPVGIKINKQRLIQRHLNHGSVLRDYHYIPKQEPLAKPEVLYFAGCMSHLTPGIKKAMHQILNRSGISWKAIDEHQSICCGRPLRLAGDTTGAQQLYRQQQDQWNASGARILLTSCPICFKEFRKEYSLQMQVMHHTQFIEDLICTERIHIQKQALSVAYHHPCELGRGEQAVCSGEHTALQAAHLLNASATPDQALCCGGSLGSVTLTQDQRDAISLEMTQQLQQGRPQVIATACPLCKKTIAKHATCEVKDTAELVCMQMQ